MAAGDHLTPTDLALETYKQALEPKRLMLSAGGHFNAYLKESALASGPARDWFSTPLLEVDPAVGYRCPDMKTVGSEEVEPDGVGG